MMMNMISSILWKLYSPELKTDEDLSAFHAINTAVERCKVKNHEMSVHGEGKFTCELFPYKATIKDSFKLHVLIHQQTQNQDTHYFKDCAFKSSLLCNYQTHNRGNHRGSKYSCNECSYTASRKSHIKIHIDGQHF